MIDTNNGKLLWKSAGLYQMIERRYHETLGQIPPAPKITRVAGGAGRPGRTFATAVAASGATVVTVSSPNPVLDRRSADGSFAILLHVCSSWAPVESNALHGDSVQYSLHGAIGLVG